MKLFICEKPSQARDIANAMNDVFTRQESFLESNDKVITWCFGHLLELAPPDDYEANLKPWRIAVLPVIPKQWVLKPQEKSKKQLTAIGRLLKKAKTVVIATDADREGDVIGREVLDYFNYKGDVHRLWLSALDEASIQKALKDIKPGHATENLYQAGLARQRADWLVGMNLTMATSSLYGKPGQGVLSVGRVQTPTLKLIVERDKQIEAFKPMDFFTLKIECANGDNETFWLNWDIPEDLTDADGRCINNQFITTVAAAVNQKAGLITCFEEQHKKQQAPLCLSLSALQKIASSQYGFGAKEVLDIAQSLYEKHKATTYPRTDCDYLPESQFNEAPKVLNALKTIDETLVPLINQCDFKIKSRVWNDKKITAHHGIIPTLNIQVALHSMTDKERKLYDLIRRHYIAQFLMDYEYLHRRASCTIDTHIFSNGLNIPVKSGWKEAIGFVEEEDDHEINGSLPKLKVGDGIVCINSQTEAKKTKPPARFTEGTLISAMKSIAKYVDDVNLKRVLKETAGIGTEATRANIIETLLSREFLCKKGKQLISTEKGRRLIELLPNSITSAATTALWEQQLESIAEGTAQLNDFLDDQIDALQGMIEQLADATH